MSPSEAVLESLAAQVGVACRSAQRQLRGSMKNELRTIFAIGDFFLASIGQCMSGEFEQSQPALPLQLPLRLHEVMVAQLRSTEAQQRDIDKLGHTVHFASYANSLNRNLKPRKEFKYDRRIHKEAAHRRHNLSPSSVVYLDNLVPPPGVFESGSTDTDTKLNEVSDKKCTPLSQHDGEATVQPAGTSEITRDNIKEKKRKRRKARFHDKSSSSSEKGDDEKDVREKSASFVQAFWRFRAVRKQQQELCAMGRADSDATKLNMAWRLRTRMQEAQEQIPVYNTGVSEMANSLPDWSASFDERFSILERKINKHYGGGKHRGSGKHCGGGKHYSGSTQCGGSKHCGGGKH